MRKVLYSVPFHSQKWDVSRWSALGFKGEDDARYWERSCCAILCLRMAGEFFLGKPLVTCGLIGKGVSLGAYSDAQGWNHAGLCELAGDIGLVAMSGEYPAKLLVDEVSKGRLPLVSIKWAFRPAKSVRERMLFWRKYGGHIALVVGVQMDGDEATGFYVHHTSIREEYNWPARFVPMDQFHEGYTGRAIVLAKALPHPRC